MLIACKSLEKALCLIIRWVKIVVLLNFEMLNRFVLNFISSLRFLCFSKF